jgi:hypothetical protein
MGFARANRPLQKDAITGGQRMAKGLGESCGRVGRRKGNFKVGTCHGANMAL